MKWLKLFEDFDEFDEFSHLFIPEIEYIEELFVEIEDYGYTVSIEKKFVDIDFKDISDSVMSFLLSDYKGYYYLLRRRILDDDIFIPCYSVIISTPGNIFSSVKSLEKFGKVSSALLKIDNKIRIQKVSLLSLTSYEDEDGSHQKTAISLIIPCKKTLSRTSFKAQLKKEYEVHLKAHVDDMLCQTFKKISDQLTYEVNRLNYRWFSVDDRIFVVFTGDITRQNIITFNLNKLNKKLPNLIYVSKVNLISESNMGANFKDYVVSYFKKMKPDNLLDHYLYLKKIDNNFENKIKFAFEFILDKRKLDTLAKLDVKKKYIES